MIAKRNCPICNNNDIKEIDSFHYLNNEEINGIPNIYDIVFCNNCSLVYADINSSQMIYDKYYSYKSNYGKNYFLMNSNDTHVINYYNGIVSFLKKYININDNILDLGCGNGLLSFNLLKNGYKNIYAMDYYGGFDKLKEYYKEINIINGHINNKIDEFKNKFDIIIVNQVLEHVYDIKSAISNLEFMLKKDGLLYFESPDCTRFKDYYLTPYHFFNYEHIEYFSEQAFENMAKIFSYEVLEKEDLVLMPGYDPSWRFILKKSNKINTNLLHNDDNLILDSINQYIEMSKDTINKGLLHNLIKSQEKVILWGIGSTSMHLFDKALNKLNIHMMVDASDTKQGNIINGMKIMSPSEINDDEAVILILPPLYNQIIYDSIKKMGLKNKVKFLTDKQINI